MAEFEKADNSEYKRKSIGKIGKFRAYETTRASTGKRTYNIGQTYNTTDGSERIFWWNIPSEDIANLLKLLQNLAEYEYGSIE